MVQIVKDFKNMKNKCPKAETISGPFVRTASSGIPLSSRKFFFIRIDHSPQTKNFLEHLGKFSLGGFPWARDLETALILLLTFIWYFYIIPNSLVQIRDSALRISLFDLTSRVTYTRRPFWNMKIVVCDPISPRGIALLQQRPEFQVVVLPAARRRRN